MAILMAAKAFFRNHRQNSTNSTHTIARSDESLDHQMSFPTIQGAQLGPLEKKEMFSSSSSSSYVQFIPSFILRNQGVIQQGARRSITNCSMLSSIAL
jgi:hypothetical protein